MYAVIKTGGKQYRVAVGHKLKIETVQTELDAEIVFDHVLLIADGEKIQVGNPTLSATVTGKVIRIGRGKKVHIVKFRRRQNSRTRTGHRQNFVEVEITAIGAGAKKATKKKATKKVAPKTKQEDAKVAAAAQSEAPKATKKEAAKKVAKKATKKAAKKVETKQDDLSAISGVGPVLVGKLNALGITTLQQIADFTKEDIERIDAELNFKGRIERDDWVSQAKALLQS